MGLLMGVALVFGAVEIINLFLVNFFLVKLCRNWVSSEFARLGFCAKVMENTFSFSACPKIFFLTFH